MEIEIRYCNRTSLDKDALVGVVKKYAKTKKKIIVTFDNRLKSCFANYTYISKQKTHWIKVAPTAMDDFLSEIRNKDAARYCLIKNILHEIAHLNQHESMSPNQFWAINGYGINENIKGDRFYAAYYSQCESEARAFENEKLLEAVRLYDEKRKRRRKNEKGQD